jgi:hypothetical protein
MLFHGKSVHVRESPIDAHMPQIAIQKSETDGSAIVDSLQLSDTLGRESVQTTERDTAFRTGRKMRSRRSPGNRDCGLELFDWRGLSKEPALPELAA